MAKSKVSLTQVEFMAASARDGIDPATAAQLYATLQRAEAARKAAEDERKRTQEQFTANVIAPALAANFDIDGFVAACGDPQTSDNSDWRGWGTLPYTPVRANLADGREVSVKVVISLK